MQRFYLNINTQGRGFINLTEQINVGVSKLSLEEGLCNIFLQHTIASLILCENADNQVLIDLENFISHFIKDGDPLFLHKDEGPDDMPAHIRTVLTQNSINIPIVNKSLALGTWQGLFLWEHRFQKHTRNIIVTAF